MNNSSQKNLTVKKSSDYLKNKLKSFKAVVFNRSSQASCPIINLSKLAEPPAK